MYLNVETVEPVEQWSDEEGWGALADSEEMPGGAFVHFSVIEMEGYRTLRPGLLPERSRGKRSHAPVFGNVT